MSLNYIYAFIGIIAVSLISLIGILFLFVSRQKIERFLPVLVAFSVGTLFGNVFFHFLPEILAGNEFTLDISYSIIGGILVFFILEKFIHWRHCHNVACEYDHHAIAKMNLLGDGLHNLLDGMIITATFIVSIPLGWATTLAVALHEIPQEIGDFGILLYGGYNRKRALFLNLISALASIFGIILVFWIDFNSSFFLIPFAAGGFIYIAATDLMPELHKETSLKHSLIQFLAVLAGLALMLYIA